jgi:integrase
MILGSLVQPRATSHSQSRIGSSGRGSLAELEYRRPYNLRHTFAYWSLNAGVSIATVAREIGHTSTEMTFKIYSGLCREMGADAAAMRLAWAERPSDAVAEGFGE